MLLLLFSCFIKHMNQWISEPRHFDDSHESKINEIQQKQKQKKSIILDSQPMFSISIGIYHHIH